MLIVEVSMLLLFCGPHTGIQGSWKGVTEDTEPSVQAEISRQNLTQGSKKDFIEQAQIKFFQRYNLTRWRLEKAPSGKRAISLPQQELFYKVCRSSQ